MASSTYGYQTQLIAAQKVATSLKIWIKVNFGHVTASSRLYIYVDTYIFILSLVFLVDLLTFASKRLVQLLAELQPKHGLANRQTVKATQMASIALALSHNSRELLLYIYN